MEWADSFQEGIVQPLDRVWSLLVGNWSSEAPANHWTVCNSSLISKDASCEAFMRVSSANGFWWQFYHQYFRMATNWQCERSRSIYKQSWLHSTDAQAWWPVYRSWLYGRQTVVSCPSWLVRWWLCKSFQRTIRYRHMTKYLHRPSFTPRAVSGRAIFLPRIPLGTWFDRNPCPWSVQVYQIHLTQRCIKWFWITQLQTAILCTNQRGLGTPSL